MDWFNAPIDTTVVLLTTAYGITSSLTVFDKRMIQARRDGTLPADEALPPKWIAGVYWLHWAVGLTIVLFNWQYALIVFIAKFVLSVLPVLEVIGNILMTPFKPKQPQS